MVKPNRTKDRTYNPPGPPLRPRLGKAHVFGITHAGNRTSLGGKVGFDYPVVQEGQTAHFVAYYDPSLGPNGKSCAEPSAHQHFHSTSFWLRSIPPAKAVEELTTTAAVPSIFTAM